MNLMGPMEWPYLQSLCGGYLHQDFVAEHGSARAAVEAYLADTGPIDATRLSSEWRTFLNVTNGMDAASRARVLREVAGGSWDPADAAEFGAVSATVLGAWSAGGTV